MKREDIYLWALGIVSLIAFYYAVTHMPESMLSALPGTGL